MADYAKDRQNVRIKTAMKINEVEKTGVPWNWHHSYMIWSLHYAISKRFLADVIEDHIKDNKKIKYNDKDSTLIERVETEGEIK